MGAWLPDVGGVVGTPPKYSSEGCHADLQPRNVPKVLQCFHQNHIQRAKHGKSQDFACTVKQKSLDCCILDAMARGIPLCPISLTI